MTSDPLEGFSPPLRARAIASGDVAATSAKVVVVGASIPGLLLASLLARARARSVGEVYLVTGPPPTGRALRDGCSLRRSTIAAFAEGLAAPEAELWQALGGAGASFHALSMRKLDGRGAPGWPRGVGREPRPIGLSTRHGHTLSCLRAALRGDVRLVAGGVDLASSAGDGPLAIAYPGGARGHLHLGPDDVVLNTLAQPLRAEKGPAAKRVVVVVQYAARARGDGARSLDDEGCAPYFRDEIGVEAAKPGQVRLGSIGVEAAKPGQVRRGSIVHVGFVTPFADPATPGATHYVLDSTCVDAARAAASGDEVMRAVERGARTHAAAFGLELVDPEATRGGGSVPVVDDFAPEASGDRRVVNLYRPLHCGAPAINVDGMLAQARGAIAFARSLSRSDGSVARALADTELALRPIRRWNRLNRALFFGLPSLVADLNLALNAPLFPLLTRAWAELGAPPR